MDEKDYKYVLTVAKYRNFTRAAEALYISQPALSRHIGLLEKRIGHPLFNREVPSLELTKIGERFCHCANKVLEIERSFFSEVQRFSNSSGTVIRIGVPPLSGDYILSRVLPQVMRKYPQIHCEPVTRYSKELYQLLTSHHIDAYIGTVVGNEPSINTKFLFNEPVYLAGSQSHSVLADIDTVNVDIEDPDMLADILEHLRDVSFISCNPPMPIHVLVDETLRQYNFTPVRKVEVPSLQLAFDLASQGIGITAILRCQLKYENPNTLREIYFIPLVKCALPFYLAYNSSSRESIPELDHFLSEVMEIYSENPEI